MTHYCDCCGKPLTDPNSIDIGYGPVCWLKKKTAEAGDRNADLFGGADYTVHIKSDVLVIVDLDQGGKSVTNDIVNVIARIRQDMGEDLTARTIIYRDSMGIYDGVAVDANGFNHFYALQEKDVALAVRKVKDLEAAA